MSLRFTIDGSDALEQQLAALCQEVSRGVQTSVPARKLEGLVLAGGYGRGQGGVLKSDAGDRPYNDLEFYVFLSGNRLWNDRKYRVPLEELGERLSGNANLHVEFKIDSIQRLRRSPVSMFSYDLVAAHRTIFGQEELFEGCDHHLQAANIPPAEATRLLFNRCTGLLLARELLCQTVLTAEQADFIGRNHAKAQLAMGDVVLTIFGQYHWSCTERQRRLAQLWQRAQDLPGIQPHSHNLEPPPPACLAVLQDHHSAGVAFKLHPCLASRPLEDLAHDHHEISDLALQVWLWLERHRLKHSFPSIGDYALSTEIKCPTPSKWRNYLLNLRTFGAKALLDSMAVRYPRERLLNTLPLLLWNGLVSKEPAMIHYLQKQLCTPASEWRGWVAAYKRIWPSYG